MRKSGDVPAKELADALDVPPLIAQLLLLRGIDDKELAQRFLKPSLKDLPDPATFADMDRATQRIVKAIVHKENIAIYGDYDVDGVTSSALLTNFLRSLGIEPELFVPDRFRDGYGLNASRVEELVHGGAQVLITVDCGTSNRAEVEIAQSAGCDVVVVDHHTVPEKPARPLALLNPARPDCAFPFAKLAAVGVAFFLCISLRRELRQRGHFSDQLPEPDLRSLLPLVALGTVADVMPLVNINRILVSHGLNWLNQAPTPGFASLSNVAGIKDRDVTSTDLGFKLAPRINAAGRMTNARGGLELLTTTDRARAAELAHQLNNENQSRRDVEAEVLKQAMEDATKCVEQGRKGLVLYRPHWHLGVVGIVAARIREAFHRPTFILGAHPEDGMVKGSGRSIPRFDLVNALNGCADSLMQFGGHANAAGVTLSPDKLESFAAVFDQVVDEALSEEDYIPTLRIDSLIKSTDVDFGLYESIERLAPFGAGNPRPVFALQAAQPSRFRTIGDGSHLEVHLPRGAGNLRAIGFGMAKTAPPLDHPVDVAFQLRENWWRGERSLELNLKDIALPGEI